MEFENDSTANPPDAPQPIVKANLINDPYVVSAVPVENPAVANVVQPPKRLSLTGYLSWFVVIGATLGITTLVAVGQFFVEPELGKDATPGELAQVQLQAKTIVGQRELPAQFGQPNSSPNSVPEDLNTGPYEQRLGYSILLGESEGHEAATEYLNELDDLADDHDLPRTEDQERLRELLGDLNDQYAKGDLDSSSLASEDQEFIEQKLGWLGRLALYPEGTPAESERASLVSESVGLMISIVVAALLGLGALLVGVAVVIGFIVFLISGKLRTNFITTATDHNIYIETFAIWILGFFGASIGMGLLLPEGSTLGLYLMPMVFLGSLSALVWPVLRGVSFTQLRQDIGWTLDKPVANVGLAAPSYLALLPFLLVGVIFVSIATLVITANQEKHEFARSVTPSHPIQEELSSGKTMPIVMALLGACVAAPLVEETMFRGVLYRHLRDGTGHFARWISVAFSSLVNGLIFAAIHPQGLLAIPMLATLGIAFTLAREWRGSLVTSMTMHGVHNTLVTCVALIIL